MSVVIQMIFNLSNTTRSLSLFRSTHTEEEANEIDIKYQYQRETRKKKFESIFRLSTFRRMHHSAERARTVKNCCAWKKEKSKSRESQFGFNDECFHIFISPFSARFPPLYTFLF